MAASNISMVNLAPGNSTRWCLGGLVTSAMHRVLPVVDKAAMDHYMLFMRTYLVVVGVVDFSDGDVILRHRVCEIVAESE